jgi:hypothetical protein
MSPTDILPPIAKNCTTFSSMGGLKNNHLYEATYTAISFVVRRSDNYKNYGKRYLDEVSGDYGQGTQGYRIMGTDIWLTWSMFVSLSLLMYALNS